MLQMQMQNSYMQGMLPGFMPPGGFPPAGADGAINEMPQQGFQGGFVPPQGVSPMCMPSATSIPVMPTMPGQPPVFRTPPSMAPPTVN